MILKLVLENSLVFVNSGDYFWLNFDFECKKLVKLLKKANIAAVFS